MERLFTPGPLNTSVQVRAAMAVDMGSRTQKMNLLTQRVRTELEQIAACGPEFTSVLLQGSGTFAVEAMLSSLIPPDATALVLVNGVYGERMKVICQTHGIECVTQSTDPTEPVRIDEVESVLKQNRRITHILAVQFETALGILNDMNSLALLADKHGCKLLIDAMSAFGALPVDYRATSLVAVAASANKCLHGAPGLGFVIARRDALKNAVRRSLSLDLYDQWREFEASGQWRFTPPVQILAALDQAIAEFNGAGGVAARFSRYQNLSQRLIKGLAAINIHPVIAEPYRAPMIMTFALSADHRASASQLYEALLPRGLVIYPTKHSDPNSFRIGCMGEISEADIDELIVAIRDISCQPGDARHPLPSTVESCEKSMASASGETEPLAGMRSHADHGNRREHE